MFMLGSGILKKFKKGEVKKMRKITLFCLFLTGLLFCFTQVATAVVTPTQPQGYVMEVYNWDYANGILLSSRDQYGEVTNFLNGRMVNTVDALGNLVMDYRYAGGVLDYTIDKNSLRTEWTNGRRIYTERQDQTDAGQVALAREYFHYAPNGLLQDSKTYAGLTTNDGDNNKLIETTAYVDGRQSVTRNKDNTVIRQYNWSGTNLVSSINPADDNNYKSVYSPNGEFSFATNKENTVTQMVHLNASGRRSTMESGIDTAKITTHYDNMGRESYANNASGFTVRYWVYNGGSLPAQLDPDNVGAFLVALRTGTDDGKLDYIVNVVQYEGVDSTTGRSVGIQTGVNRLESFNNGNHGVSLDPRGFHLRYEPALDPAFTGTVIFQDGQYFLQLSDGTRLNLLQSQASHHGLTEGGFTIDTNNWFSSGGLDGNGDWATDGWETPVNRVSLESYLRNNLGKNVTLIGNVDGISNFFVIAAAL